MLAIGPVEGEQVVDGGTLGKALAVGDAGNVFQFAMAAAEEIQIRDKIFLARQDVTHLAWVEDFPAQGKRLQRTAQHREHILSARRGWRTGSGGQKRDRQYGVEWNHESSPPLSLRIISSTVKSDRSATVWNAIILRGNTLGCRNVTGTKDRAPGEDFRGGKPWRKNGKPDFSCQARLGHPFGRLKRAFAFSLSLTNDE